MEMMTERGTVPDYIPELACVSNNQFGIAVVDMAGNCYSSGAAQTAFSIQSVSKVFSLTMALAAAGDDLWARVGREASGSAFNSIVQLETECGIPRNPFINAGAIVMCDLLLSRYESGSPVTDFLDLMRKLAGSDDIDVNEHVFTSEAQNGFRNRALANYMRAFQNIENDVENVLNLYFQHCALQMNCIQLAAAGRFLMTGGEDPSTREVIVSGHRAKRILALMMTSGHYDGSGEFAYRVGIPAKSGVGGGILAIAPGNASIAVWSPGLNERGNSQLGTYALEQLTHETGWSVFEP